MVFKLLTIVAVSSILFSSCEKGQSYTVKGRVMNGTTGEPLSGLTGTFVIRKGVAPASDIIVLSDNIKPDLNGYFELTYQLSKYDNGLLYGRFERISNPFLTVVSVDSLDPRQDNEITLYDSDSGLIVFSCTTNNALEPNEELILDVDGFAYLFNSTNLPLDGKILYRTPYLLTVYHWMRVQDTDTIHGFGSIECKMDPFIDHVIINY